MSNKVYFITNRKVDQSQSMEKWIYLDDRLHIGESEIEKYNNNYYKIKDGTLDFYMYSGSQFLNQVFKKFISDSVIIYFHGFDVSFESALCNVYKLQKRLNENDYFPDIVVFSFPSNGKLNAEDYLLDQDDAKKSGQAVSFLLNYLEENNICGGKPVINLILHSMGNFVLQHGFNQYKKDNSFNRIFQNICMVAADVNYDVFENDFSDLNKISNNVSVFYNEKDWVLGYSNHAILKNLPRLGKVGPKNKDILPERVELINVTDKIKEDQHGYLTNGDNPEFLKELVKVLIA